MTDYGEPEYCPCCNGNPSFEEIVEGEFQCQNCGAVIRADGTIIEEGEESN